MTRSGSRLLSYRWRTAVGRSGWPLTLLLFSLGLAGVVVLDALRSLRSQDRVADAVLQDYSHFAAWSYGGHLRDVLAAAAHEAIGSVNHGSSVHTNRQIPSAADLPCLLRFDPTCECRRPRWGPVPAVYYAFSVRADTIGVARNQYPAPDSGWRTDDAMRGSTQAAVGSADRWVLDTLRRQIHSPYRSEWGFNYVVAPDHGGAIRYLAYTLMPTAWGDTLVYGVEYSRSSFARLVGEILEQGDLLPLSITSRYRNDQLLVLEVDDASALPLFASEPGHPWRRDGNAVLPRSYGGLQVRAEIRPEFAGQLLIGGLPRSRLPFLVTLLLAAAGLSAVAVGQLRREGELNQLRSDFVATVSHELRTPLTQIRLDLDTLRLRRYPNGIQRAAAFDRVDRETRRLAYLTENILRFSRRRRAPVGGSHEAIDPGNEAARTVEEFRPLAAARRTRLELDIDPCAPIACNADAFRQILLNLLDNAVKYGPPRQTVVVKCGQTGYTMVRITVIDQGPGVCPDELALIWEPFHRGARVLEQGIGGSGIGLTVVSEAVAAYGGRTGVDPAPSGGAAFFVEFPIAPAAAPLQVIETASEVDRTPVLE